MLTPVLLMDTLLVLLLIGFCVCFVEGNMARSRTTSNGKPNEGLKKWEKHLQELRENFTEYKDPQRIGDGVLLSAQVMYDKFYQESVNGNKEGDNKGGDIKDYFEALFKGLETYFHKQFIFVNITVASVTEMKNLTTTYDSTKTISANETLKNIQEFGSSQEKENNTIFYLFTWPGNAKYPNRSFDFITTAGEHRLGVSEAATNGTFCSSTTSAALVRHKHGSDNFWSTARATFTIFGSDHFYAIPKNDRVLMNATLSRCPLPSEGHFDLLQC
uniref:28 kDa Metastriate family member n=1 Tax=Rhipicephalus zambeziensis TaxID=60191 RepID=A0A224Y0V4_9ACAR